MSVELRPVTPEDLATIDRWALEIGSSEFMSRTRPLAPSADHHDPASGLFWYLVISNGLEVGTVWIEHTPQENGPILSILLSNHLNFGHGIGTAAVNLALSEFHRVFPNQTVVLYVRQSNHRAIACYQRVGFTVAGTGSKTSPLGKPITFLRMVRPQCSPIA